MANKQLKHQNNQYDTTQSSERFKYLLGLTRLRMPQFAEKHGFPLSTLKFWSSNRMKISAKSAHELRKALLKEHILCTEEWLVTGQGQTPKLLEISDSKIPNTNIESQLTSYICECDEPLFLVLDNDKMAPLFNIGDVVAGDAALFTTIDDAIGQICIIQNDKDLIEIGKFNKNKKEYYLSFCNPKFENYKVIFTPSSISLIAPIIWIRRNETKAFSLP